MNKYKKVENEKYIEKTKNMNSEDKKNYEILLNLQNSFESLVNELQVKIFPEEFDFYYDSSVDTNRRRLGKNPMNEDYITRMNENRIKFGFLPLTENGFAQDSKDTFEYCKKLITKELDYKIIE
ncbi:MAG: hypothetical protein AB7D41_04590 [Arcobacter sp.]|uniref:hypothetical protein n=1 Tax=Arcobacter sp. TaxID=1872629 RepID=UPI003CFF9C9C